MHSYRKRRWFQVLIVKPFNWAQSCTALWICRRPRATTRANRSPGGSGGWALQASPAALCQWMGARVEKSSRYWRRGAKVRVFCAHGDMLGAVSPPHDPPNVRWRHVPRQWVRNIWTRWGAEEHCDSCTVLFRPRVAVKSARARGCSNSSFGAPFTAPVRLRSPGSDGRRAGARTAGDPCSHKGDPLAALIAGLAPVTLSVCLHGLSIVQRRKHSDATKSRNPRTIPTNSLCFCGRCCPCHDRGLGRTR